MQSYTLLNDSAPKAVRQFLQLVREQGKIIPLNQLYADLASSELIRALIEHDDWLKIEDIIDACVEEASSQQLEHSAYCEMLAQAFNSFYPVPAPLWAEFLKSYLQKFGNTSLDQIVPVVHGALDLCRDRLLALAHGDNVSGIDEALQQFFPGQKYVKKDHQTFVTIICSAISEMVPLEGKNKFIQLFAEDKFEMMRLDPPQDVAELFISIYDQYGKIPREMMKQFGLELTKLYPRSKCIQARASVTKNVKAKETVLRCLAVADLLIGDITNIDPVIGDEACEARPPIILDIHDQLIAFCDDNLEFIINLCEGFLYRHRWDNDAVSTVGSVSVAAESVWSQAFVEFCKGFAEKCGEELWEYLFLCKAATYTSKLASDEWGLVSYDRFNSRYSLDGRTALRRGLSLVSCAQVRSMALKLAENELCDGGFWGGVSQVLQSCKAIKFDQKDKFELENSLSLLPIYETMRTVFAWQFIKNRPIVLTIYRLACEEKDGESKDVRKAEYKLLDVPVLVYRPDTNSGNYVLSDQKPGKAEPCLSIQAYQLVNHDGLVEQPDGCDFMMDTTNGYLDGFLSCDIGLLTMIYSAVHPPLAGGVMIENIAVEDHGLALVEELEKSVSLGEIVVSDKLSSRKETVFNLCRPVTSLAVEYLSLRDFGIKCGLGNMQYITRPGGGQVCVRTLESVGFTIHHINVQRYGQIVQKAADASNIEVLARFHNFDAGQSYETLEQAQSAK